MVKMVIINVLSADTTRLSIQILVSTWRSSFWLIDFHLCIDFCFGALLRRCAASDIPHSSRQNSAQQETDTGIYET